MRRCSDCSSASCHGLRGLVCHAPQRMPLGFHQAADTHGHSLAVCTFVLALAKGPRAVSTMNGLDLEAIRRVGAVLSEGLAAVVAPCTLAQRPACGSSWFRRHLVRWHRPRCTDGTL